jgi:hypothetical protein
MQQSHIPTTFSPKFVQLNTLLQQTLPLLHELQSLAQELRLVIPADQAWFWTKGWQAGEAEANEDLQTGQVEEYQTVKEFLNALRT